MKSKIFAVLSLLLLLFAITGCGSKEYYCDEGDTLKGTSCISEKKSPANPVYTCRYNAGTYLSGDKCIYTNSNVALNARIESYTCYSGYLKGTECIIETSYNAYER